MNNQVIPLGSTEVITDGTVTAPILCLEAITDLTITDLVFIHPHAPANANAVDSFTLPAGGHLFHIKSLTFVGTANVIYQIN